MDSPGPRDDSLLTVTTTSQQGVVWIVLRSEADLSTRERLRSSLAEIELGRASLVYLDLRLLTFCDWTSCRTLLRFERRNQAAGHDVRIHRPRPIVRK
jgi:hypothetical protein